MALTATIAESASLSDAVLVPNGEVLYAIQMPAAWDAADLTFQMAPDGATYGSVYTTAGEMTVAVDADRLVVMSIKDYPLTGRVKLRSGTVGTPVNQTAARTLTVYTITR